MKQSTFIALTLLLLISEAFAVTGPSFRSIETNTYLARSANKGKTAFINNNGKTIKRLEPDETGNIELEVPLINNNFKNKNDLIFFVLLFTYLFIFLIFKNKN